MASKIYRLILFILLSTSFIQTHDASNASTGVGLALFATSVGLTIAKQKYNKKPVDESEELAKKLTSKNHIDYNLPTNFINMKAKLEESLLNCKNRKTLNDLILDHYAKGNTYEIDRITQEKLLHFEEILDEHSDFVKEHEFQTKSATPSELKIFVTIHGSATNADSYGKDPKKDFSQKILRYVQTNMLSKNANCIVIPFEWDGKIDELTLNNNRYHAGQQLAETLEEKLQELNITYPDLQKSITFLSHSHGLNVGNEAAIHLKSKHIYIDKIISFAGPALQSEVSKNIGVVVNIYSGGDSTGALGSLLVTGGKSLELHKIGSNIKNINLIKNGSKLDHFDTKTVGLYYLPLIEEYLTKNFINEKDLIISLSTGNEMYICGFIDETKKANAFELEAIENNPELTTSIQNQQKLRDEYPHYQIYTEPNILDNTLKEAKTALKNNFPSLFFWL